MITTSNLSSVATTLESNALPSSAFTKMMKICISGEPCTGASAHYFTVEARSGGAGPMDSSPSDWDFVNCNAGGRAYPNYALYNAQWGPGQTYTNATHNFRVAVLGQNGSKFDVSLAPLSAATGDITPVLFLLLFD